MMSERGAVAQLPGTCHNHSEDAEWMGMLWLRRFGYLDAHRTGPGPDGGIDIEARDVVGQVKNWIDPVGIADVQRTKGAAVCSQVSVVFAAHGFTNSALEFADRQNVALFRLDRGTGAVTPLSTAGHQMMSDAPQRRQLGLSRRAGEGALTILFLCLSLLWLNAARQALSSAHDVPLLGDLYGIGTMSVTVLLYVWHLVRIFEHDLRWIFYSIGYRTACHSCEPAPSTHLRLPTTPLAPEVWNGEGFSWSLTSRRSRLRKTVLFHLKVSARVVSRSASNAALSSRRCRGLGEKSSMSRPLGRCVRRKNANDTPALQPTPWRRIPPAIPPRPRHRRPLFPPGPALHQP